MKLGPTHLGEHGFEAGPGLGVQGPGDVAGGALKVFLAFASAHLLSLLYEGMVGGAHPLQEQVVAIQELAVALQEVHGDGQHPPQDVGKPVPQLRQAQTILAPVKNLVEDLVLGQVVDPQDECR